MRKIIYILFLLPITIHAQTKYKLTDDFTTNSNGWTESVSKKSKAILQEGVLLLESKGKKEYAMSWSYLGVSLKDNFELSCKCIAKSINNKSSFGLIFNRADDLNYCAFMVREGQSWLFEVVDGRPITHEAQPIKLKNKKNQEIQFEIKNKFGNLTFYVNGMEAISGIKGKLIHSGFGFLTLGDQTAMFDDLTIIQ